MAEARDKSIVFILRNKVNESTSAEFYFYAIGDTDPKNPLPRKKAKERNGKRKNVDVEQEEESIGTDNNTVRRLAIPSFPHEEGIMGSLSSFQAVGFKSCIYVICGELGLRDEQPTKLVYINTRCPEDGWKQGPSLDSSKRVLPAVGFDDDINNGKLFLIREWKKGKPSANILDQDPGSHQWRELPPLPLDLDDIQSTTMHGVLDCYHL